jgi:hypothetical protein
MPRNVETPADVDIHSMRKQFTQVGNLLEAGPGTPWDDRGSIGVVPAFVRTVKGMLTHPARLLAQLRRPETPGDARAFALICCGFWAASWVLHDVIAFARSNEEFDYTIQGYTWVGHAAQGFAGCWFGLKLVTRLFYKLASAGEMRSRFPIVLANNVYSYCLAPSVLALIPYYIGPGIAAVWIFFLLIHSAVNRLAIKKSGAIICNTIAFVAVIGAGAAIYFVGRWLVRYLEIIPEAGNGIKPIRLPA